MRGYDQWKTASPYDDEPDPIEEAEAFLKRHAKSDEPDIEWAKDVIQALLDII